MSKAFRGDSCSCDNHITAGMSFDGCADVAPRSSKGAFIKGQLGSEGGLNVLFGIEPEGCNSVRESGDWTEVEFAVDSGATETVMNEDMLNSVETKEGVAAKRGVVYEVANGVRIPNLGEKRFVGYTAEGGGREVVAQVCDVNKALLSVRRMVAAGNRVVFGDDSYIESMTTGERVCLEEKEGMYIVNMWIKSDGGF